MVAGEQPDDVRVERVDSRWAARVTENGKVTQHLFEAQVMAESFAEAQRTRLGLPGKPPVHDLQA